MNVLCRPKVKTTYSADIDTPDSDADVIYTVLAKDNFRWRTIVTRTENIELARLKMTEASLNSKYDRVIICQAPLSDDSMAFKWETIECALPPQSEQDALRLASEVRHDLQCLQDGVCITPPSQPTHFGKRHDDTERLKTLSNVATLEKPAASASVPFIEKLKKLVEAA